MGTRRRANQGISNKKKSRRTKDTSRAAGIGAPEFETARAAKRASKPRKDSVDGMIRIYDGGWDYDEDLARAENSAEKGYYILKVVKALIPPDDAYELFCQHNYDKQRNFDEAYARRLAATIVVAPNMDFAIGPDGKCMIENGQHQMWAIFLRGLSTQAAITIWMCKDEQAMADLFCIFDDNKRRSFNNAIHAAMGANSLTFDGNEGRLAKWSQCVAVAENEFSRKNISREGNDTKLLRAKRPEVQEFAQWMESFVQDPFQAKLVPQGIGASFYAMWQSDRIKADQFAAGYFTGANLAADSPPLYMRNKMANRPKGEHSSSVTRDHAEFMFTAWRKFCLGEPLLALRRTIALPTPDRWKVYRSAANATMKMTIGGNNKRVRVAK